MLNWSDIDTVLLDMDGTLLDLSYDNFFWHHYLPEKYAEKNNLDLNATRVFLEDTSARLKGNLNWYCLDHWSELLDIDLAIMKGEISHLIRFRPHTAEFLAFLRDMKKQMILVTNAHPKTLRLKAESSGLQQHLDRVVSSHDLALAKENTGFWPKLASSEAIDLTRSLFIDDSLSVLSCARNEGVKHTIQILQPDTGLPPVKQSDFPGIVHFEELMTEGKCKNYA
jgi:5'-nucleotidase